jgi:hypothetical protein
VSRLRRAVLALLVWSSQATDARSVGAARANTRATKPATRNEHRNHPLPPSVGWGYCGNALCYCRFSQGHIRVSANSPTSFSGEVNSHTFTTGPHITESGFRNGCCYSKMAIGRLRNSFHGTVPNTLIVQLVKEIAPSPRFSAIHLILSSRLQVSDVVSSPSGFLTCLMRCQSISLPLT